MDLERVFLAIFERAGKLEETTKESYRQLQQSGKSQDLIQGELFAKLKIENRDWSKGILRDYFDYEVE
jgi:hypothetical protein